MELFMLAAKTCGGGVSTILWITLPTAGPASPARVIIIGLLIGPGGVSIFC